MTRQTLVGVVIVPALMAQLAAGAQPYDLAALEKFRAERETALKTDNSWLTVAGLHFLNQGDNRVGSDATNDIVLDFPSMPKHAAVITMTGTSVRIRAAEGQVLTINNKQVQESDLHGDFDKKPRDTVHFGAVTFFVHYSGPRLALRVRDQNSTLRTNFRGLRWYPANPAYRVVGSYTPLSEPRTVQAPNILGDLEPFDVVGHVTFALEGSTHKMEAWRSGKQLWFVYRDQTSGRETYPSARFLYADAPVNGQVVIDFNYSRNPPCAYNSYTTCPLPPAQNRLPIRIEAGEMKYLGPRTTSDAQRW